MDRNLKSLFEHAIDIEMSAAKIYRLYEKLFHHIPDVAKLWMSMAQDEIKHAEVLKESFESLPQSVLDTSPGQLMWQNMVSVKQAMKNHMNTQVENLDDALDIAHQMESSEINAIFKFLAVEHFSDSVRESFIESELMDHQKKLVDFSEVYNSKNMRERIKPGQK